MPLRNSFRRYGSVSKTLHWATALLVLSVIPLGLIANGLAEQIADPAQTTSADDIARAALLFSMHKTLGVSIFVLALLRILWALSQPRPGLLNAGRRFEATLAETVHWVLYGALVLVPLAGWISHSATTGYAPIWLPVPQALPWVPQSDAVAALFGDLHKALEQVLVVALLLHIAGALKHHYVDRDFTLRRMWPGRAEPPEPPAQHRGLLPAALAVAIWAAAIAIGAGSAMWNDATNVPAKQLDAVRSDWQVSDGSLGLTILQLGNRVEGGFADWTAKISFEEPPTPGPAGTVNVTIAIGSLSLGSVTAQAMGPVYFDITKFPTARFAGQIEKTETGYVATGPLTIRDRTVQIDLPFALDIEGDVARMTGATTVQRLDFDIGSNLPDESSVGFAVEIAVRLSARRNTGS